MVKCSDRFLWPVFCRSFDSVGRKKFLQMFTKCFLRTCLLLHLSHGLVDSGDVENQHRYQHFREDIGQVIAQGVDQRMHAFGRVLGKKDIAGNHMAEVAPHYTYDIADNQAVLFMLEKPAQPKGAKGQGIV